MPIPPYLRPPPSLIVAVAGYWPEIDHRRSIRLPTWDYAESGAYFVTFCSHNRAMLFGGVEGDMLVPDQFGRIVEDVWTRVVGWPASAGEFVVMPNHVHGIVWIQRGAEPPTVGVEQLQSDDLGTHNGEIEAASAGCEVAQPPRRGLRDGLESGSLFVVVRTLKSASAKRINAVRGTPGVPVWQRGYYERVIRNERELEAARLYILDNPLRWAQDKHNPDNV